MAHWLDLVVETCKINVSCRKWRPYSFCVCQVYHEVIVVYVPVGDPLSSGWKWTHVGGDVGITVVVIVIVHGWRVFFVWLGSLWSDWWRSLWSDRWWSFLWSCNGSLYLVVGHLLRLNV
jgi:hypothetical protein